MDEYIDQLLAEMHMPEPAQKVVRNILDEPIPESVKRRLLNSLFPKKNIDLHAHFPRGMTGRVRQS